MHERRYSLVTQELRKRCLTPFATPRVAIDDASVTAVVSWVGGSTNFRFGGPVQPDEVTKVGTVDIVVPDTLRNDRQTAMGHRNVGTPVVGLSRDHLG